jgi:hypothetical protein
MSKRHEEFCSNPGCGAILKLPAELDTGLCLVCLQRGECGEREEPEPAVEGEKGTEKEGEKKTEGDQRQPEIF